MFKGTIGIIGARGGSKRVPNKNLRKIGDCPLITYSILTSRASYFIDTTIVSTDSNEIAEEAYHNGAEIIMRPEDLAQDNSTDYGWIYHLLEKYRKKEGIYPKNLVFLRPTTPFRRTSLIDSIISSFNEENTSLRSVEPISEAVEKHFKINGLGELSPICSCVKLENTNNPNHSFSTSYKANGYCDILKTEYILDSKSLYGNKIQAFETPKSVEIDTLEDLEYAEYLLKNHKVII